MYRLIFFKSNAHIIDEEEVALQRNTFAECELKFSINLSR